MPDTFAGGLLKSVMEEAKQSPADQDRLGELD
jgi:hypothetical protein